jgi:peptidyl-prolyl cis-trans isomerase B (cyclophilin B)
MRGGGGPLPAGPRAPPASLSPVMRRPLLVAAAPIALLLAGCGSGGKTSTAPSTSATPPASTQASSKPAVRANGCKRVSNPPPKPNGGGKKPKRLLDASKTWTLTVRTSCGAFTITLNLKTAPKASASMVSLARAGFFDRTTFHRIVPGFVIQGGDPTGTGTGGPGYSTVDPPPRGTKYTRGVVAMAKTQSERRGTAGSQFYVVTGADAGLPPDYAVIGRVTKGLSIVERIGRLGDQSEQPTQPVIVYTITARGA